MTVRRIRCRGDCGRWWYYDGKSAAGRHAGGRPREWCPRCLYLHKLERKRVDSPNLMSPRNQS